MSLTPEEHAALAALLAKKDTPDDEPGEVAGEVADAAGEVAADVGAATATAVGQVAQTVAAVVAAEVGAAHAEVVDTLQEENDRLAVERAVAEMRAVDPAPADDVTEIAADVAAVEDVVDEVVASQLADEGVDVNGDGESNDEDKPPTSARRHWWFRSAKEWRA